ncbi:MAG: hypothetical protein QW052_06180 [Candidatus Nitrosocaldaceae archaeon]
MDKGMKGILRAMSILAKGIAMSVEMTREYQMVEKEIKDRKDIDIIDYGKNKMIYEIALWLKEISRRSGDDEGITVEDIKKAIEIWNKIIEKEKIFKVKK